MIRRWLSLLRSRYLKRSIVLVLTGVVLSFGCSRSGSQSDEFKKHAADVRTALGRFEVDVGRYPTTSEGLGALIKRPSNVPEAKWLGPYLDDRRSLRDPWGHDFVYSCPGVHNSNLYDFYSMGPDGVSKTGGDDPDDISNWPPKQQ